MNRTKSDLRILIRGANDVGSAVAHRLFMAGHPVVLHETLQPTTTRRKMAFTDSIFDGDAMLEGVLAKKLDSFSNLRGLLISPTFIPTLVSDFYRLLEKLRPQILVDARMRKHTQPARQIHLAPLTIGLGPNFSAGNNVHLAIETGWGESLGRIIERGAANPLQGEPREIDGHARDRYVYAPMAGRFVTPHQIGDMLAEGQEIARINSTPLLAPITGILRGLTHDGVPVTPKTKVIELDPRTHNAHITGIGERPARIAEGVFIAIQNWEAKHVH